jgi:hypothetical protein
MMVLMCILQIDNLINPEALTITGLLVAYIFALREELKSVKKEIKEQATKHLTQIESQAVYYREEIKGLVYRIDKLHEEKYKLTREIIPLLIELIEKLDREEKNHE